MGVNRLKEATSITALLVLSLLLVGGKCWCFDSQVAQFTTATQIDFSIDNQTFLSVDSTNSLVNFWRIDTKALIYSYSTPSQPKSAKFSKDGVNIGIGMSNGNIIILNISTYSVFSTISNPLSGSVVELDFSWNSNSLLACSASKLMFMSYSGSVSWTIIGGISSMYSCKLNKADGAGFSYSDRLYWYQYNTNTVIASDQRGGGDDYREVDFSLETPTGMRLMGGNKDNDAYYIISGDSGTNSGRRFIQASDQVLTVCQSKDGKFVAAGDKDGYLHILNTTSRNDSTFSLYNEGVSSLTHCRFSYDNRYLAASSGSNGNIYFYTTECFPNKCRQGYYDNSGVCASCSIIASCLACSSSTTCTACIQGFYLSGSSCVTCASAGCRACESISKCLECVQGFYLDYSTNTCVRCNIPGCIACQRNSTLSTVFCRQCNSEYYLNGTDSVCIPCTANNTKCMRCSNSSACLECQMSYYLDSLLQCQTCTGNCLVCTNSSLCLVCIKGYYSSSGSSNTCVACGTNCLDCYNTGSCSNCAKGTYLNTGSCYNCIPPCMTCNSTTYCHSCMFGFYYNGGGSCLACSSRCFTCNSSSYCTSCEIGSYLTASNTCTLCYLAYPNCTTCNIYNCLSCQVGYYYAAPGCQLCTSISGCNTCSSLTTCTQCFIGFYLSGGSCLACPSQCQDCSDATTCTSCSLGYYLSVTSCLACTPPCVTCTSSTNCLACQTSYYLDTSASPNTCIKCSLAIIDCLSCASSSVCNECELGRYVTAGGACSVCPLNCSTCNSTSCLSCSIGFYPTSGYCLKCQQNCSQCASSTNCSSCNVGYYLVSASNSCTSCTALGCETCNANGCLSCQAGFLLSATRTCLNCNSSFVNCQVCSESACTQCLYGFYLNAGACSLCYSTMMGCAACYNSSSCGQCEPGYYLQANSTCAFCPSKCRTCNSAASCTSCQLQYTFNAGQTDCLLCESYIDGCQYCTTSTACQTCYQGFYLSSPTTCSFCKTTLIGCVTCFNSTSCSVCQDQYYLLNGVCVTCELIPSCNYCLNSSTCLSCRSGYYLNSNNTCSICTASLPGCIFCASSSTCRQCQAGYFLNAANQCQQCLNSIVGCLSCLNSTSCIQCDGGYYLSTATFQCVGCNVTGCQICGDSSPNVCNSCSYGYYLSGTTCNACPQTGCLDCTSAAVCLECQAGYFLSGNSCTRCENTITACSKCLNSTVCSQCDSTFYLNSSLQCSSCSLTLPSCVICFNSAYCTTCSTGYYSQSGVCTSCSSITGCFMCQSSSTCQNCVKGYYLSGTTCTSCSSSLTHCFECTNSSVCLSCTSGYLLDTSNVCQQVTAGTSAAPDPIPQLQVKTFYVSSQALKHILYAKQGYSFTKQSLTWNSFTTISLYNSATMTTTSLTITSVQWGGDSASIIFFTNNPLNLNANTFSMPMTRLLVTSEDFSLSYQTKFSLTKAALSLLMPDVIFSNDFTQEEPLMKPSFYTSYIQNSGEYYFTIMGYVIVAVLFANFLLKASCTYPNCKDLGEVVPHVLALKTCALVVYPIFPQVANFCYGLMAADIPWFFTYYGDYLAISSDVSPAGFQLFYLNMNFASLYLIGFVACLLLLFLGCLSISKTPKKSQEAVFSLQPSKNNNRSSYSYIRMIYLFFSFGLTFAGSASIQGSLYNPVDYYSINGAFYMIGGVIYCVQLGVVLMTRGQGRSCYLRSFLKASFLSVAHISPIYICTLAVAVDLSLILYEFCKYRQNFNFPKAWLLKNILVNLSLLCLFYYNEKKIALLVVVSILFLTLLVELMEHLHGSNEDPHSKRVKPAQLSSHRHQKVQDEKLDTIQYFAGDFKLQNDKEADLIDPKGFNQSNTTFKSSAGFTTEFIFDQGDEFSTKQKAKPPSRPEKRNRPFRNTNSRNSSLRIQPILQDDLDGKFNIE